MDRKREGRMQCLMKKEDKSLIDLEHVETTGERWCTFIGIKHISPTFMYINHTNVFEADDIYNPPPPSVILHYIILLFRARAPPVTLQIAGALTNPQLPETASNVCTTDARLAGVGGVPTPPPP